MSPARAVFEPTAGPGGGAISAIVQVESGDVFVIAGGFIHRSTDVGQTWSPTSAIPGTSTRLASGPGNRLYAFGGTLYVSEDSGESWTVLVNAPNPCLALVTNTAGNLLAGSSSGLFMSIDLGATWTNLVAVGIGVLAAAPDTTVWYGSGKNLGHVDAAGNALPGTTIESGEFSGGITALAARTAGGVYAGTGPNLMPVPSGGGVWRVDADLTKANIGLTGLHLTAIVARPDDTLIVGSRGYCSEGCSTGGAYFGTSTGGFSSHTPGMAVRGIVDTPGVVLVATAGIDGNNPPPETTEIAIPPFGVLRSVDNGASWQPSSVGLPFARVYSVAANPSGTWFATAEWRIYRSPDHGASWSPFPVPQAGTSVLQVLAAPTSDVVYGWIASVVYRAAADGSSGWTLFFMPTSANALTVTAAGTLLAISTGNGQNLMRSATQGSTWTTQTNVFPPNLRAWLTSGRYGRVAASMQGATMVSDDNGMTWETIGTVSGPLAFSADETILYVGQSNNVVRLEESNNWAPVLTPAIQLPRTIAVDATGLVYASTSSGVQRWTPGNVSWENLGPSFPGAFQGRAGWLPQVIAGRDGFVLATTYNAGVWRLDTGVSDSQVFDGIRSARVFPNPFRSHTTIGFDLVRPAQVELSVFDVRGRRLARLLDGARLAIGPHRIVWQPDAATPRGVYLYELRLDSSLRSGRLVLR